MKMYNYWDICNFMEKINYQYIKIKHIDKKKNKKKNTNNNSINEYLTNLKNLSCLLQI